MTMADVVHRPTPGPSREYRFPAFERLTLSNGLRVVVAPVSKLPIATVIALVDAGASADPRGQEGVALLTARALAEGTQRSDGAELAARFERLGTALDAGADWDSATLRITATSERFAAALALLAEVIRVPSFPEREVERLRQERLAELLQQQAEPRGLADDMFGKFAYAPESRYALPDGGLEPTVDALSQGAVRAFYGDLAAEQTQKSWIDRMMTRSEMDDLLGLTAIRENEERLDEIARALAVAPS